MRVTIKLRQIINYDAGIVLIDLHQLNVKTTSDNTNRHWIRGNLMSTKNRTHQNNNPQHPLSNQMIEWSRHRSWAKRVREFLSLGHWSLPSRLTSEKRAYTLIKSDEEWTSRVLPSEQDDIVNSLNYEGIAVIELQFTHFHSSDRLRVGSVTD